MALYTNIKGPVSYTTVGNVTIENDIVSGFDGSNYLKTASAIDTTGFSILEICVVYDNVGNSAWRPLIGGGGITCIISNGGGVGFTYSGTTYYNWNTPPATGKVIFKFIVNIKNKSVIIKWSSDNGQTYKTTTKEVNTDISVLGQFSFAYANAMSSANLYLKESSIKLDNTAWFGSSFSKVKLRYIPIVQYTIIGVLNIVDGIASGFTNKTDYFVLPIFSPNSNKWKFTTKIRFNSLAVNMSLIDRNSSTRNFQISMRTNGKWRVNISNDGSSKTNEVDGSHVLSVNTWYYLTFEYTGTNYILKYSTDDTNWTTDITINNSNPVYSGATQCMGHTWYNSGEEKWDGEIDMNYTHLLIENQYIDTFKLHCLEGI